MRMHGGDEAFLNKSFKLDDPEWDRLSDLSRQAVLTFSANGTRQTCGLHCTMSVGHFEERKCHRYVRRADELRCVKVHGGERINILERSSFGEKQ